MLEIVPGGFSLTSYQILQNGSPLTEIRQSWSGNSSTFSLNGASYRISHEIVSGDLVLRDREGEILRAHRRGFWKHSFYLTSTRFPVFANQTVLESHRLWRGNEALGSLHLQNWFQRSRSRIELPDLPLPASVFLTWVTVFSRQNLMLGIAFILTLVLELPMIQGLGSSLYHWLTSSLLFLGPLVAMGIGQIVAIVIIGAIAGAIGSAMWIVIMLITRISLAGRRQSPPIAPFQQAREEP
jgi:energy-converting hydrogenase Eha subunit A